MMAARGHRCSCGETPDRVLQDVRLSSTSATSRRPCLLKSDPDEGAAHDRGMSKEIVMQKPDVDKKLFGFQSV